MRKALLLIASLWLSALAAAQTGVVQNHSFLGGKKVITSGTNSTNYADGIIPGASITVYLHNTTTKATIYTVTGGPLANPFFSNAATAVDPGGYVFRANLNVGLDVVSSGGGGDAACTIQPNCYLHPVTLLVDVFPNSSISPIVNPLTIQTNEVGNTSQALLDFKDTASVLFTNPSGGIESATVPDGSNSSKGILKCDGTTTDCTGGTIVANPGVAIQTNGTPNTSQVVLNHVDTPSVTWSNPSGGVEEANVNFTSTMDMQIVPPIPGQYVFVPASTFTNVQGDATGNASSGLLSVPLNVTFEVDSGGVWTGYILPSYVNPANVTAVYGMAISSLTGVAFAYLDCQNSGPPNDGAGFVLSPVSGAGLTQKSTLLASGAITDLSTYYCGTKLAANSTPGAHMNIPKVGLLVYYTGTAPPSTAGVIYAQPPLNFNPGSQSLEINIPFDVYIDSTNTNDYGVTSLTGALFPTPGQEIKLVVSHGSTSTTPTFTIGTGAAATIVGPAGAALVSGDIATTSPADLIWSGTNWRLQNPQVSGGGGGGSGSVGTAGQMQMVGATAGSFAASACTDDGSTITCTEPINTVGPPFGISIDAGTPVAGASGTVVYASDATVGYAEVNENNTGLSRVCTAANGICGSSAAAPISRVSCVTYGCVADGNLAANTGTDNTTAFGSCLTAAIAANDVCYVPAGVYRIAGAMPSVTTGGTGFVGDVWGNTSTVTAGTWPAPITQIFTSSNSATILTVTGGGGVIAGNSVKNIAWQRAVPPLTGAIGVLLNNTPGIEMSGNTSNDSSIGYDITYVPNYGGASGITNNTASFCYSTITVGAGPEIGFNLHGGSGFQSPLFKDNGVANNCGSGITSYGYKIDGGIIDLNMDSNWTALTSYGIYMTGSGGQDVQITNSTLDRCKIDCVYTAVEGNSIEIRGGWMTAADAGQTAAVELDNAAGTTVADVKFLANQAVPVIYAHGLKDGANAILNNRFFLNSTGAQAISANAATALNIVGNTIIGGGLTFTNPVIKFVNQDFSNIKANWLGNGAGTGISFDASSDNNCCYDLNTLITYTTTDLGTGNSFAAGSSGLSGMTATQVPIAATATTVTSSKPLAGAGSGITTGPTSSTTADDLVTMNGTDGRIKDSGILSTNVVDAVTPSSPITASISGHTLSVACPTCGTGSGGTSVSQNSGSAETNLAVTGFMPQACANTTASGTAQVCTVANTFTPQTNNCVVYTTNTTNSGTGLTVNVNSLGAKSVAIPGASGWTTTLTASIIPANKPLNMCYDGTNWNVQQTGTASIGGSSTGSYFGLWNYTVPLLTNLTWVNQGGATATQGTNYLNVVDPAVTGDHWRLLTQTVPGVPYTLTIGFTPFIQPVQASQVGICLYDSGSGKIVTWQYAYNTGLAGGSYNLADLHYTNTTTYSATGFAAAFSPSLNSMYFLRVQDNGTNRLLSTSLDGINWTQQFSEGRTTFLTPTDVGVCADAANTTSPAGMLIGHYSVTTP